MSALLQAQPQGVDIHHSPFERLAAKALKSLRQGGGNIILLAGLQNGELLNCLRRACGPQVLIIVAAESMNVLEKWEAVHGKDADYVAGNTVLYMYTNAGGVLEKYGMELASSSRPVMVSMLPANDVERLFAPLTAGILDQQYRRKGWQQRHIRLTREIVAGLCDADNNFLRIDILVRCLAIEHFLTYGSLGSLYPKMQSIRRNMAIDGMPCRILCEQFKRLIMNYANHGYDLSRPVTIDPSGHLVDGAHRLACAIYFKTPQLTVVTGQCAKKRPFDMQWFERHFSSEELAVVRRGINRLMLLGG